MNPWLAVFLGGGVGSLVRYAISLLYQRLAVHGTFPWATLTSNVLASAFLAWLVLREPLDLSVNAPWRALLVIGFCGGFSTMSTFSLENFLLLREGLVLQAVANMVLSVGICIAIFYLVSRPA